MAEFEMILNGLKCCKDGNCDICPYTIDEWTCDREKLMSDAIELIQLQIPRVLTLEEIDQMAEPAHIIIAETRDDSGSDLNYGMLVEDRYEMDEGSILFVSDFKDEVFRAEYGKHIRLWNIEPSREQMEAVKWE